MCWSPVSGRRGPGAAAAAPSCGREAWAALPRPADAFPSRAGAGGVVSGLGKGVTASSIGVLLKACGHRVTSIKASGAGWREQLPRAARRRRPPMHVMARPPAAGGRQPWALLPHRCFLLLTRAARTPLPQIDPYLNVDAGTMSPFEHGEVFVLDDGGEVRRLRCHRDACSLSFQPVSPCRWPPLHAREAVQP